MKRKAGFAEEVELNHDQRRQLLGPVAVAEEPSSEREVVEADEFVEKDPKDQGEKGVVYKEPALTREEITSLIQTQVLFAVEGALGKLLPGKLGEKHRRRARFGTLVQDGKTKKLKWKD
ncbi:MAG: hypothetical protein ABSD29_12970 [Verrucomicrobiota bacterium]